MHPQKGGGGAASAFSDLTRAWPRRHAEQQSSHQIAEEQTAELVRQSCGIVREQSGRPGARHELAQGLPARFAAY
jgi:hypothetical protein